jgi:hypothetical protein
MEYHCVKKRGRLVFIVTILGLLGVSLFVTGASAENASFCGGVRWNKTFGGTNMDLGSDIQQTRDGEFIVDGASYSNDGDVSGNHGLTDAWVVKLNASEPPRSSTGRNLLEEVISMV